MGLVMVLTIVLASVVGFLRLCGIPVGQALLTIGLIFTATLISGIVFMLGGQDATPALATGPVIGIGLMMAVYSVRRARD